MPDTVIEGLDDDVVLFVAMVVLVLTLIAHRATSSHARAIDPAQREDVAAVRSEIRHSNDNNDSDLIDDLSMVS